MSKHSLDQPDTEKGAKMTKLEPRDEELSASDFFNATGETVVYNYIHADVPAALVIPSEGNIYMDRMIHLYVRVESKYNMALATDRAFMCNKVPDELTEGKIVIVKKEVAEYLQLTEFEGIKCKQLVSVYRPQEDGCSLFICWHTNQ